MYPEKYADQDKIVESAVIGESESMSSQDAVVTPTNRRPGAYAVFLGRSMQHRQDDAGTTTATVDPTTVVNEEFTPIAAEVAEDTLLDISSHIRRVLAEDAVPASSVAALNGSGDWLDKSTRTEGESSRHWRRLILVILCLILVAVAATVSVVVLKLTKDSEPTIRITIVIKLDDHPEETPGNYTKAARKLRPILQAHIAEIRMRKSSPKLTCVPEKNTRSPCTIREVMELTEAITKSTTPLTPQIQLPSWSKDRAISLMKCSTISFP
jgi:hypothetical protein